MIETNNDTWRELEKKLQDDIADFREQNDSDLDEKETANLRGRIRYAKELLELGEKPLEKPRVVDASYVD